MKFNYEKLLNWKFTDVTHDYSVKDTTLYALGLGLGHDPLDRKQLQFIYEEYEFKALPTMAVVLASPGFWARDPDTGIDWKQLLHGEQGLELHKPLPAAATVVGQTRVTSIIDKGLAKGSLLYSERILRDAATDEKLATLTATSVLRGNGGYGGPSTEQPKPHAIPDRAPDAICDLPTNSQLAMLYRLSGDYNPLHIDPDVATSAGFKAPILHGLCTFGIAGHAILKHYCRYDPAKLQSMSLRFSSPVYPGETIRTEMWCDAGVVSFRARAVERDIVVLNNGHALVQWQD